MIFDGLISYKQKILNSLEAVDMFKDNIEVGDEFVYSKALERLQDFLEMIAIDPNDSEGKIIIDKIVVNELDFDVNKDFQIDIEVDEQNDILRLIFFKKDCSICKINLLRGSILKLYLFRNTAKGTFGLKLKTKF